MPSGSTWDHGTGKVLIEVRIDRTGDVRTLVIDMSSVRFVEEEPAIHENPTFIANMVSGFKGINDGFKVHEASLSRGRSKEEGS